jgi:hypothetical protein
MGIIWGGSLAVGSRRCLGLVEIPVNGG